MHPLIPIAIIGGLIAWANSSKSDEKKKTTKAETGVSRKAKSKQDGKKNGNAKTKPVVSRKAKLKSPPVPVTDMHTLHPNEQKMIARTATASQPDAGTTVLKHRAAPQIAVSPEISSGEVAQQIASIVRTDKGKRIFDDMHHQRDIEEVLTALLKTRDGRKIFQGVVSSTECNCTTMKDRQGEKCLKILFPTKEAAQAVAQLAEKNYGDRQRVYPCKDGEGKILGYHLATAKRAKK